MPENTEREWRIERFEVVGYGRRYGTVPYGGRASGWNLGSVPYVTATAAVSLNCSAAWSSDSQAAGSWVAV